MDPHRHHPEGLRLEVRGCDFYTFRNGLVVRKDSYWKIVAKAKLSVVTQFSPQAADSRG